MAYLFKAILLWPDGRLTLHNDTSGTGWPTSAQTSLLTLDVNGTSFSFADVQRLTVGYELRWSNTGLTWNVNDTIALTITEEIPAGPSVASIAFNSAGMDGAFKTDDAVTATVTFSESVTVDTTDGTPQLTIKMGGADKVLDYSSGSPGTALVFSGYTVAANDEDTDGLSVEASKLDANSGTIKSTADATKDAVLTHAAVAASANHKVDGVKPTLVTSGDLAPKTSLDGSKIILNFSEPIGSADATKFTVKVGTTTQTISGGSRSGPEVELTLTTALAAAATNITVALAADAVTDVPGNGIAAVSATSVTRTLPPGKPTLTLAAKDQSIDATVVFSAHGTSDITKYQYQIKSGSDAFGSWTDSTEDVSNTGGTFTIGSLTNGTEYTVQVRGVNSDGDGAASDAKTATPDAPPAITSVAITSDPGTDRTYIIGDLVEMTVTFDKIVTLSGTGIHPQITVNIGDVSKSLLCDAETPASTALVCSQNLAAVDGVDSDGISLSELALATSGKKIVGPLGQEANLDYSALDDDADHKVDGVKPTLSRADADPNDLTKIILTFSEAIGTIGSTGITVKKGTTDQSIDSVVIDSTDATKVVVTLDTALLTTDTNVTVDLAADTVKDVPGNGIAEVLGTSVSVEDNVAPTFVSAGTSGTDKVVLTYSEALNTTAPATSAFTVKVGGNNRGVDMVAISGSDVTLTLASAFRPGDTLTVAYAKPGSNPIKDAADNEAVSLAETTVTNLLAATAPEAPGTVTANFNLLSFLPPLVFNADLMDISWTAPWNNGSAIEKFQYRYAEGTSVPPSTGWADVPDSAPGGANHTSYTVSGLDVDTEYTFEVRAVNGEGNGDEASVTKRTRAVLWSFTLRNGGDDITQLTEGGDAATATVSITNDSRFSTDQTVTLAWGLFDLDRPLLAGASNETTITILAEESSGSLEISAPQFALDSYDDPITNALTATHGGTEIGSIQLTRRDDESPPVAAISDAPTTVNEGESIEVEISLNPPFGSGTNSIKFAVTGATAALSGTPPTSQLFGTGDQEHTVTLTAAENTTQNDGAHEVTFALQLNDDSPYTLGTPPAVTSVTITVRDDDTPPLAPANLRAQAGNTEATLRWDAPPASDPDHGQPVLHYEYRVKVGTAAFGSWTTIPGSDADTRSHKFTGLTNNTEYTYEVRAENVAGDGAEAEVMVTPVVGVAVSFGAATLSVDEGGTGQATLTLATAPAAGTTVVVPITATAGEGLDGSEYSGVPSSVTFNAGDTSKSFTVTAAQDTLDEPDEVLTLSLGTLPSGYVPGTEAELEITVVDDDVAQLGLTLRDSSTNDVTRLTEGGDSATATVSITNNVLFSTEQTVTLEWGDDEITSGLIQGAGGSATFTIGAEQASGSLEISAPDRAGDLYRLPETRTLTASIGGTQVDTGIELEYVDDEAKPVITMVLSPSFQRSDGVSQLTVVEGDDLYPFATLSRGYDALDHPAVLAEVTGSANKFVAGNFQTVDGKTVLNIPFNPPGETQSLSSTLGTNDNSTAGDSSEHAFTIVPTDYYTLGTPSSATLTILDNDVAPTAPRNLAAQSRDGEVVLTWDPPTSLATTEFTAYELRHVAGSSPGGAFSDISTDPETTTHTVTGLTNETEYTFELRAKNSFGSSSPVSVSKTPRVGIAVSFGEAALSVDENDSVAVTVTLGEAPASGTTVEVPITETRGEGLFINEYSGVPENMTFGAGETSKSFTVTAAHDTDDEPDAVLTLGFGTLPEGYVVGAHETLELTVVDDDYPIVSASFGEAAVSVQEGLSAEVTVGLSQVPEREVVVPLAATRGANLGADEYEGVPESVTFAADETEKSFTVTFTDDAVVEGNETLTLAFGTVLPERVNSAGANPQLVLTVTDDDGPPDAPADLTIQTGDGYAALSWPAVSNDSPILRYEVRWKEEGGSFNAWLSVNLDTSYRAEGLTNGKAHTFEVRAVNAHGEGERASAQATPTERLTGIPKAVQGLWVKATDSGRADLSWGRPSNATDRVTANSATATFAQIQGYRIEVCRTACDDETNWYALVANTGKFEHRYTHQVLAPGVIRENRYRVQAININGKVGPWSNVATLAPTEVRDVYLQTPNDSTLWVRFRVRNPDGNLLYVRYENTGTGTVGYAQYRLTKKQDGVKLVLSGLDAGSWYRVDLDFVNTFDSERKTSWWYGTAKQGHTPLRSPYRVDALDAQVWQDGAWKEAPDNALRVRMGGTGKYRVRLKPCLGVHDVFVNRIQAPAGRLRASPMDVDPSLFMNLNCESEFDDWRRDENGNPVTMDQIYDMTNFAAHAKDLIPLYAGTENNWKEVTVTARALEDYPTDTRADALLSAPFAVVYNHRVRKEVTTTSSYLVSDGTGLVRVLVDRPADAVLPVPSGVAIGSDRVMSWDAVPGAWGYLIEWRHGAHYSDRANRNRNLQTATSITLPPGASGRGPVTARVRAYSASGVSDWSAEVTWDSRPPTLNVLDTAVNEADGSVGFLVTLDPAATGTVTVNYATKDGTAVAPADYTATSGTLTFAPGNTQKQTALVPITDDGEEDSGETFTLMLSNPTGSDANNGAAVLGDSEAVATILNSEREAAEPSGFTLVDAGTNADLMALAGGVTVSLGDLLAQSYGIRAEMSAGAAPGSVRLELSGAKTVTNTDDAAPWSLYGDGAGRINGGSLPPGSYTLSATAYADSGARGEERGSLEVSFTVTAGSLGVTTQGPFTVAEGETSVAELAASDTGTGEALSWSIPGGTAGGADAAAFTLASDGTLSLAAAKDFEAPDDANTDGTYEVTVEVREGAQSARAALLVTLSDVDEAPLEVTTLGPFTVAEGTTAVAELAASDTGTGETVSWSIPEGTAGGADGAAFALTPEGVLTLVAVKDFEAPDDADGDGTYEVTVEVTAPATVMAGAQTATAALSVTLSDVNEAPVAKAAASPERVREGAVVTLDGSASADPDTDDTLSYAWTQADDGAPRVTLSDESAAEPVFTSPSDLAAETELGFTLRVTDAAGLHSEDGAVVTVTLVSEVSIAAGSDYAAEGADAVFRLTRAGSALAALVIPVSVEETGAMLGSPVPEEATFAAGSRETEFRVPTAADAVSENDSRLTVELGSGSGWQLADGAASASLTVLDDDAAAVVVTSAADVTIWSAEMTVVEYSPRAIGAGTADLFSNQQGRAGLRAKWLWYDPTSRKLKLGFDDSLDDAESLTLHMGSVSVGFPDNTGGNSSFSLEGVDLSWTDGETLVVRVSKPSTETVSTDATLASLAVEGASLSPAFDAGALVYRAIAEAGMETVTLSATATDGGASVAYGPGEDADTALADHQVALPDEGETLVEVTVTAADGTVRRYRVVVARGASETEPENTAPTGLPAISGTPQVGVPLTASESAIEDGDGLENATYVWQWIANDGTRDTDIEGATSASYTPKPGDVGKTLKVRVTFTDDAGTEEVLTSVATETVAANVPDASGNPAAATAEGREGELTVSWTAPAGNGGAAITGYRVQWKSGSENYDGSESSTRQAVVTGLTHTISGLTDGTAYTVRILAVNEAGDGDAAEVSAEPRDRVAPVLSTATVDGATLTLTYSEALDENSAPGTSAFAVTVAEAARTVDAVTVSGSAAVLTLGSAVASGETVGVGYTAPTGTGAKPLQDAAGNGAASFTGQAVTNDTPAPENTAPTGLPAISGTPQVGVPLTASESAIEDGDGLENATYVWQWIANDGAQDADIEGATAASYTPKPGDVGKTLKVRVTFTDDAGTEETLVSVATSAVAANVPDAPGNPAAATAEGREGELTVSWTAPAGNGGAAISGYKVQWKSGSENYDGSETSTRQAEVTALTYTISGLTDGTAYTVRILAVNEAGDGDAVEVSAEPRDRVAPVLSTATVDGATLTLTYSEALDENSAPGTSAFAVTVAEASRTVDAVTVSGSAAVLTLGSAVASGETVGVGYTAPTGAGAKPLQDAAGNGAASFTGQAVTNDTPAPENTAPTGLPAISGTPQVGVSLTASGSAIEDGDGLENATYVWQWIANDGTRDTDIEGATSASYTPKPGDVGKTLKVRVTFTDDAGTEEALVSVATETVAVNVPDAPGNPAAATAEGREGELTVSWTAPAGNGGAAITGYRVQWKSGSENYDGSETSTRQAEVTALTYTISGLTDGTAYTVRILAVNEAGDGDAVEVSAEPRDRVAPVLSTAAVDGATLTLTYSEALDENSAPGTSAFAVTVAEASRTVDAVTVSGSAAVLTLGSAVASGETVGVGYTAPTGAGAKPLQDAAGNGAASFTGQAVTNDTPAPENTAPTGLPAISGTPQVGVPLTASESAIEDGDGLENATYVWQWIANDGTRDTEIEGATAASYTPKPGDVGKTLKVRVTFTDDAGTEEALVSAATDTVVAAPVKVSIAAPSAPVTEGSDAVFTLTRTGDTTAALTVAVSVSASGAFLDGTAPTEVAFAANAAVTTLRVATKNDGTVEADGRVSASVASGTGYVVAAGAGSAGVDVFDNDKAAPTETVLWSADMTVVDYETGAIGAGSADLLTNQGGSAGITGKSLWYYAPGRKLRLAFMDNIPEGDDLTLHMGSRALALPDGSSGNGSVSWENIDIAWSDGETISVRLTKRAAGETSAAPGLSVADAQVREAAGAELVFRVTLDAAQDSAVSVRYATADGTATAGSDYVAARGAVRFAAGQTSKTVRVLVLEDSHDDNGETMTLKLSSPFGATLADGTATGTIANTDPLPKAWLARFGRTVANHVVEAVRGRMSSAQGPSRRVSLGGADLKKSPALEITQTSPWDELIPEDQRPESFRNLRVREFLLSSSFEVPLAENASRNPGPRWTAWGGAARTSFSGQDSDLSIDGDVTTATLGVDRAWDRVLLGLVLARSTGDGSYNSGDMRGDLKSSITSAHPYLRFSLSDRLSAWTLLGYGKGELTLTHGGGEERTDIEMKMVALGARGALVAAGGFDISARSDALLVRTSSEGASEMAETEADVSRLRLVLEGSRPFGFASGSSLIPSVEVGVRRDGGDAERGVGFEVGGAMRYVNPSIGLTVEITARRLMAHEQDGYSEWGAGGSVQFAPGGAERGFSAKLGSSVGTAASGVEGLWAMGDTRGLAGGAQVPGRVDAEAGYAMGAFGGSGVITPYGWFSMSGDRKYRAGWRLSLGDSFNLSLEGDRTENPDAPSRHGVALRGSLRW